MNERIDPAVQEIADAEFMRAMVLDAYYEVVDALKQNGAVRVLIEAARDEAMAALTALITADPEDPKKIRELQWQVSRYGDLCRWVALTLSQGEAAQEDLTDEQRQDFEHMIRGETGTKE